MDQCSRHDTPSVLQADLTNQPGHALTPEIGSQAAKVLTSRRARNQVLTDLVDPH
jgi:hypothetical protein